MQLNFVSYGTTFATSCLISIQIYSKKKSENIGNTQRIRHLWREKQFKIDKGFFQPEIVKCFSFHRCGQTHVNCFSFPNDLAYIVCCKCNYYGSLPCYKIKLFYSEVSYNQVSPPLIGLYFSVGFIPQASIIGLLNFISSPQVQ